MLFSLQNYTNNQKDGEVPSTLLLASNWSLILESKSIITVDPFCSLSSFVHLLIVVEEK